MNLRDRLALLAFLVILLGAVVYGLLSRRPEGGLSNLDRLVLAGSMAWGLAGLAVAFFILNAGG